MSAPRDIDYSGDWADELARLTALALKHQALADAAPNQRIRDHHEREAAQYEDRAMVVEADAQMLWGAA